MTTTPLDPYDRRTASAARGLLATFNTPELLEPADVHVATRLGALTDESSELVLLAVAFAVRAARLGSVCVDLADVAEQAGEESAELPWPDPAAWKQAVAGSVLVSSGVLRVDELGDGSLLYLDRDHREEVAVCRALLARLGLQGPDVDEASRDASVARLFPAGWDEQRAAAIRATGQRTTVLTGGPGTGKTASVARMLALMVEQFERREGRTPRIALAAPTGKASTRLQESVAREAAGLAPEDRTRLAGLSASTLHRLLGWIPDSGTRFRHNLDNPLPYDLIVVDEVSMVSLSQMARLLEAVRDRTQLILVGDPDQLASVEAGAVLADLVEGLAARADSPVVRLHETHRTKGSGAGAELDLLAQALRDGDADRALGLLTSGSSVLRLVDPGDETAMDDVRREITDAAVAVTEQSLDYTDDANATRVTDLLDEHRLLCAHREGPYGVAGWNRQVERLVADRTGVTHYDDWYAGRQVLITSNDRGLGLSNGDIGVVVRVPDGRLRVVVRAGHDVRLFAPTRLSGVETVFAMTVHKSQGSEARAVTVVLPPEESRLLTRELFYTAVTRARERVTIVGTEESLRAAVARQVQRASGLADRLAVTRPND